MEIKDKFINEENLSVINSKINKESQEELKIGNKESQEQKEIISANDKLTDSLQILPNQEIKNPIIIQELEIDKERIPLVTNLDNPEDLKKSFLNFINSTREKKVTETELDNKIKTIYKESQTLDGSIDTKKYDKLFTETIKSITEEKVDTRIKVGQNVYDKNFQTTFNNTLEEKLTQNNSSDFKIDNKIDLENYYNDKLKSIKTSLINKEELIEKNKDTSKLYPDIEYKKKNDDIKNYVLEEKEKSGTNLSVEKQETIKSINTNTEDIFATNNDKIPGVPIDFLVFASKLMPLIASQVVSAVAEQGSFYSRIATIAKSKRADKNVKLAGAFTNGVMEKPLLPKISPSDLSVFLSPLELLEYMGTTAFSASYRNYYTHSSINYFLRNNPHIEGDFRTKKSTMMLEKNSAFEIKDGILIRKNNPFDNDFQSIKSYLIIEKNSDTFASNRSNTNIPLKKKPNPYTDYDFDFERMQYINQRRKFMESVSDLSTIGKIVVYKPGAKTNQNSITFEKFTIPFQFNAKIGSQSIVTKWAQTEIFNRIGAIQTFVNVGSMDLTLDLYYMALSGPKEGLESSLVQKSGNQEDIIKEQNSQNAGKNVNMDNKTRQDNMFFYNFWNQKYVDGIMYSLRALQLPMQNKDYFLPPPIIQVDFGPLSNILKKPGKDFTSNKTFIVKGVNITQDLEKPLIAFRPEADLNNQKKLLSGLTNSVDPADQEKLRALDLYDYSLICPSFQASLSLIEIDVNLYQIPLSFEDYYANAANEFKFDLKNQNILQDSLKQKEEMKREKYASSQNDKQREQLIKDINNLENQIKKDDQDILLNLNKILYSLENSKLFITGRAAVNGYSLYEYNASYDDTMSSFMGYKSILEASSTYKDYKKLKEKSCLSLIQFLEFVDIADTENKYGISEGFTTVEDYANKADNSIDGVINKNTQLDAKYKQLDILG